MATLVLAAVGCNGPAGVELADARGLERLSDWSALPLLSRPVARYNQQTSRDRGARDSTLPLADHGNRDFNNFVCISEGAELGKPVTPWKVDLPACPERYAHGAVLARFGGPGRLVRMWVTSLAMATQAESARRARLRIYVDDDPTPGLNLPLTAAAMPDSADDAIFAAPFGAASPHRLAWYYPIAFREKLIVTLDELADYDGIYFHCDVLQTEPEPVELDSAQERVLRADAIAQLKAAGNAVSASELAAARDLRLAPGVTHELSVKGPATITSVELRTSALERLPDVRVQFHWDEQPEPAIELSLRDLFGAGERVPERSSAALQSEREGETQLLALRLPMPFAAHARIELVNTGASDVELSLSVRGEAGVREGAGRLHAQLRETRGPSDEPEHVALDAAGRGRVVGVCVHVQGHPDPGFGQQADPLNVLEGDVRATIDRKPALDGTGSEEYADDAFYFRDTPHGNAFAQVWGVGDGKASFCRWHVLGGELDFARSIRIGFERGGAGNPGVADLHRTVAWYYLTP
ncbi:MAG TPA: DUF2961 domain-containing protein [Polyangiales bacterium]|nr:DUF2961 domain-containing protein [Polyangiales bacterium]